MLVEEESDNALNGIMILADAHKLSQVFRNLISNAIKFTPEGGSVVVRVSKVDVPKLLASVQKRYSSYLQIEVTDTGLGIAKVSVVANIYCIFCAHLLSSN